MLSHEALAALYRQLAESPRELPSVEDLVGALAKKTPESKRGRRAASPQPRGAKPDEASPAAVQAAIERIYASRSMATGVLLSRRNSRTVDRCVGRLRESGDGGEADLDRCLAPDCVIAVSYTHLTLPTTPYV